MLQPDWSVPVKLMQSLIYSILAPSAPSLASTNRSLNEDQSPEPAS